MKLNLKLPLCLRLALLFGTALFLLAQTEHVTPFTGSWKMSLAKSRFNPGPPFQRFTITFTPDGTRNLDLVGADGQRIKVSLPWSDGKEVHPTGMEKCYGYLKDPWQNIPRRLEAERKGYRGRSRCCVPGRENFDNHGRWNKLAKPSLP